jgi:hypothetical protein
MDKVQNLSNPEFYTPSSELFRIKRELFTSICLRNMNGMLSPSSWTKLCMICNLLSFIQLVKTSVLYLILMGCDTL